MPCGSEQDICNFFVNKSKDLEESNISEAKSWLLTGRSMLPKNFQIQLQSYLLEKRQRNAEGSARCFEALFRLFPMEVIEEVNEMANAVKAVTLSTMKETEDEQFLHKVFNALPDAMRMDVFMHRCEHTPVILDKCQSVLLMVKLFPDIVSKHGGNMLYTISGCDDDVHSLVRNHLVTELVPAVLHACDNLQPSPVLVILLNQCIEYYVLVDEPDAAEDDETRWEKLFEIVDQIGTILDWKIAPFFRDSSRSGVKSMDTLFQALVAAIQQRRKHYHYTELAYIAVVLFLRCITSYYEKITSNAWKFGDKGRLTLVEVFLPPLTSSKRNRAPDPSLPVITTVSQCSTAGCEASLLQYFITATKIWQFIQSLVGDPLEKEFFLALTSMKSLNFNKWNVFQEFEFDYKTYIGKHTAGNTSRAHSAAKLASMYCGLENYKVAAEYAVKVVNEIGSLPTIASPTISSPSADSRVNPMARARSISGSASGVAPASLAKNVNFSFYNCPSYTLESKGFVVPQRRVHFISENKSELLHYACNILIQCFNSHLDVAVTQNDDRCIGHLMTLMQLEWYSPPADMLLSYLLDLIRRKGSFRYFPYFADFVIEGDILEQFMALSNSQSKPVALDIFSAGSGASVPSSRRMGTRGVERGAKNDLKAHMKKQLLKNGRENLEALIIKFLTLNKVDILTCLEI